ncbi:MAG TPA: hypothetical protein VFR23_03425 [Jiangellaceae bacterium]|nr:hypothetical protein [Jiangellaceae bacterium]
MTPEERSTWRATGAYPERKAPEPPPAASSEPEVAQQEADSAKPDADLSEAARTLRRNRAAERKQRIQDEIDTLTRKKHELARDVELFEARRKAVSPDPPSTPSAPAVSESEPILETFDGDFTAFLRARDAWLLKQFEARQRTAEETRLRSEADRKRADALTAHQKRVEEARQQFSDWDAVVNNPELPQIPTAVLDALLEHPQGPRLAYRLARDPQRMQAMLAMSPVAAVLDLGRLAADLDAPVKAAPKTVTSAPPPAPTLGERPGVPSDDITDAAMSGDFARYKAAMNAKQHAAGRHW